MWKKNAKLAIAIHKILSKKKKTLKMWKNITKTKPKINKT